MSSLRSSSHSPSGLRGQPRLPLLDRSREHSLPGDRAGWRTRSRLRATDLLSMVRMGSTYTIIRDMNYTDDESPGRSPFVCDSVIRPALVHERDLLVNKPLMARTIDAPFAVEKNTIDATDFISQSTRNVLISVHWNHTRSAVGCLHLLLYTGSSCSSPSQKAS